MSITKKLASVGLAALTVGGLSVAASGTASAATCTYSQNRDAIIDLGLVHAGTATGDCGWLAPGQGLEGHRGQPNTISLGNLRLPDGSYLVGFVDDPTGLYPVTGGDGGNWNW
ncbi:hypothetical protein ACT3SZ_07115 [Corynebacterium sp. AOP40-9SA-29]|uniref:hypothetical protein n=1 Tax=Corynebacterium sp. AOP40-9SA-29 TaxID=3457677 RepID=UPI004034253B